MKWRMGEERIEEHAELSSVKQGKMLSTYHINLKQTKSNCLPYPEFTSRCTFGVKFF